jgi:hypothetical protein
VQDGHYRTRVRSVLVGEVMGREPALKCVECATTSTGNAVGWRAYLVDWRVWRAELKDEDEAFEVVVFCPDCAEP